MDNHTAAANQLQLELNDYLRGKTSTRVTNISLSEKRVAIYFAITVAKKDFVTRMIINNQPEHGDTWVEFGSATAMPGLYEAQLYSLKQLNDIIDILKKYWS